MDSHVNSINPETRNRVIAAVLVVLMPLLTYAHADAGDLKGASPPSAKAPIAIPAPGASTTELEKPDGAEEVLARFRIESGKGLAALQVQSEQKRKDREQSLQRLQDEAKAIQQKDPAQADIKKSAALGQLTEKARLLWKDLNRQLSSVKETTQSALAGAMLKTLEIPKNTEAPKAEDLKERKARLGRYLAVLRPEMREMALKAETTERSALADERTQITQLVNELARARQEALEQERGAVVEYKTEHHKGHQHRKAIYTETDDKSLKN